MKTLSGIYSVILIWVWITVPAGLLTGQQAQIDRIESIPALPQPYEMRNWKEVAHGYDSYIFDFGRTGQYLPLIRNYSNTINYPGEEGFGLHTVVGTTAPTSSEAINVLPALIGATLVGIDKSNQDGVNWVKKSREFFNRRPEENVYLNHPSATSGSDWWYDTMPNVFFYQLYSLYPGIDEYYNQLISVAEQWLKAVQKMGGSTTPWTRPNMNYRGWYLASMTPNATGVRQPEAAGAIAWLLYNAYTETGDQRYRIGAEWAMEFLNARTSNPSYELQLAYGAYIAARMNAELGTGYDIEKLLNWCFDVGSLRNWGMILGTWGGYGINGLIGEVNGFNDYAFLMNTFEQAGALVPLVRYDDRYARAIGKWMLHTANAARLFYPNYLSPQRQDNFSWASQYDSASVIAYEALRQSKSGFSPFATGDAMSGNWGETNLALYGSSHVGIFGGIIDTTDVEMILRLDLLKTDYFAGPAYPSYLYYNPHDEQRTVTVDFEGGPYDLYDAVTNSFIHYGVSGGSDLLVPSDGVVMLVLVPSGGTVMYEESKLIVNSVIVDFNTGISVENYPPRIKSLSPNKSVVTPGSNVNVYCTADDLDGDALTYIWNIEAGSFLPSGAVGVWTAPDVLGEYYVVCDVDDGQGGTATDTVWTTVAEAAPNNPEILSIRANPFKLDLGETTVITCEATDPDGGDLTFFWSAIAGTLDGAGHEIQWIAPSEPGNYSIVCSVENSAGGETSDSILIPVRDFTSGQTGDLVLHLPFTGNADDISGFSHNGTVSGAMLVADRNGIPESAYMFDGNDDVIGVSNTPQLNFQKGITVSAWLKVGAFFTREAYPLSHGNWENRWKISVTENRFRWTVRSTDGIKDLDSRTVIALDTYYHLVTVYDGSDFEIYINGELDAFSSFSGDIAQTSIDLTVGQVLPNIRNYNFRGTIDEVRIHDYALTSPAVYELFTAGTKVRSGNPDNSVRTVLLYQNYPNPFNPETMIRFYIPETGHTVLGIFDVLGREVAKLIDLRLEAGEHSALWNASGMPSGVYYYTITNGPRYEVKKMVMVR
jgi:hypothetical protein